MAKNQLDSVGDLTGKLLKLIETLKLDMLPCSRLAVHMIQFEKYEESSNLLTYFKRVEKSTTSFWCRNCHKEIKVGSKSEHEDYHFAMKLVDKKSIETETEKSDRIFAQSLHDFERNIPAESPAKRKKSKITDYFPRI